MRGKAHDGETAAVHEVEVEVSSWAISFRLGDEVQLWRLSEIEVEPLGDQVRLRRRGQGARLTVGAEDWRAAAAGDAAPVARRHRRRERRLVIGLFIAAAAILLFVFVGVPLASGPLARMTPPLLEESLGETYAAQLQFAFPPCAGEEGQDILHAFGDRLEDGMDTPFNILVEAVEAPMVNAFALPGGRVLITGDLIAEAETPDELAAVIAHEAAHVEQRHVMQAVWRSLGLGMILDAVVGGGTGAGQQVVLLAGSVTELRYSREAEAEADARGQEILQALGYSSEGMAPFFRRLAGDEQGGERRAGVMEFLSTHPDSLGRAAASEGRARPGAPAFSPEDWRMIKAACDGAPRRSSSD
ncbi:M48 family metallopeptidase [Phenylobacterium sp.]|uniref:M48 family metallopeptidase n=1 Tax=Phenylobacterium sp. TaxID=1871053 RepID=UPI00272F82CD|nr:M48 family metallopeptidase [Phenylobacterium sp.]MDP2214379.1 M48 family metallopeptidase [Phenylobacterium sp.]